AAGGAQRGRRPLAVVVHQGGGEHFNRPRVEGPVVDDHLHGGAREAADPLGSRGGTDDNVHAPHQATQRRPFAGGGPDERDVRQSGVGDGVLQAVRGLDRGG